MKGTRIPRRLLGLGLALLLAGPTVSLAAKPDGAGGGPPDGHPDHSRGPNDNAGSKKGTIFGDQWVVVRDVSIAGDGAPVGYTWLWPESAFTPDGDFAPPDGVYPYDYAPGDCVQPVSFQEVAGIPSEMQFVIDDFVDAYGNYRTAYLIPLDPECKIPDVYADTWGEQVMEIGLGRMNIGRSPQGVMDASYEEAISTINLAVGAGLDPAGRLLLLLPDGEDADLLEDVKTIDSPLENLSLYQKLMQEGCLAATETAGLTEAAEQVLVDAGLGHLVCTIPNDSPDDADLHRAAAFFGGAADKTGKVNVDLLTSVNTTLLINDVTTNPDGSIIVNGYFDFGSTFAYVRSGVYGEVAAELLQPTGDMFYIDPMVYIYDAVFLKDWPEDPDYDTDPATAEIEPYAADVTTPVVNFVRAADDALSVIEYIHNYDPPVQIDPVP